MNELIFKLTPEIEQEKQCDIMLQKYKETMKYILDTCPDSSEKSLAVTKLEGSIMWAMAAVIRNV